MMKDLVRMPSTFFASKTPAYCSLECSLMVEFTDDDGDELF